MLDLGMTFFCGLGCVGAIICAAHSPRDGRLEAVSLSCLLIVNWALFILAYTDWSPKWALEHIGIETTSVHLWMVADTIGGAAALIAYRFWWGWALWAVSLVQMGLHSGMDAKLFDPIVYTDVMLNGALLVQLAIFFAIGGGRAADILNRGIARYRLSGRKPASSASPQRSKAP